MRLDEVTIVPQKVADHSGLARWGFYTPEYLDTVSWMYKALCSDELSQPCDCETVSSMCTGSAQMSKHQRCEQTQFFFDLWVFAQTKSQGQRRCTSIDTMRFCTRCTFHLLSFVVRSGADCLESAVPEIERSYIKDVTGEDVEIDLVASDWPASEFVTALAKVLIQEALGYKAKINPKRAFSGLDSVLALTGCDDMVCSSPSHDRSEVALEVWLGAYGGDYDAFGLRHPDKLPEDIGSIGYEGEEAMFVSSKLTEEAYEESGQSLNWYRSYNASWSLVRKYFASLSDLPLEDFAFCNDSTTIWTELPFMNDYARWSGDTGGLIEVPGGYTAKCDGGGGRFWISPACRYRAIEVNGSENRKWRTDPPSILTHLQYHFRLL